MLFNTYEPWKFAFSKNGHDLEEIKKEIFSNDANYWGIIGVPFDSTSSYHSGSRLGPIAIREASHSFEKYNFSFNQEIQNNFYDFGDLEVIHGNCKKTIKNLEIAIDELLSLNIKPIVLGGEHSISLAPLKAISKQNDVKLKETTVIHFDAHMDMIDTYQGEKCSHATVMRRIHELSPKKIIQIGVRSASNEEDNYAFSNNNIQAISSNEVKNNIESIKKELLSIDGPIYITLDLDVLDPSYMPKVGNPIPNGISINDIEQFIEILAQKNVLGLDVVELSTNVLGDYSAVTAAKIVYDFLTLSY